MTTLEDWREHAKECLTLYGNCMLATTPNDYMKVRREIVNMRPPEVPTTEYIDFADAITVVHLSHLMSALRNASIEAIKLIDVEVPDDKDSSS